MNKYIQLLSKAANLFEDVKNSNKFSRLDGTFKQTYNFDDVTVAVFEDDEFPEACKDQINGKPELMTSLINKHGLRLALEWIDDFTIDLDEVIEFSK